MPIFPHKSFLRNFYLTGFFFEFIFAYAIYTVLFSLRGLTVFEIALLIAWWSLTAIIFEVPSGALADFWSRKRMLTLAPLIKALCFTTWFFANGNFYLYALGFTLWSVGDAFMSGTSQALLYDTLVYAGKRGEYEKIWGRSRFYFHLALGISILSGGFIAASGLEWALLVSIIPLGLSAFFASRLQEVPKVESAAEIQYLELFKIAFREIKAKQILRYLFIYFLAISIFGILEEFDQLYFQLVNLPIFAFGIVGFIWSGLNATGTFFAYKFKTRPVFFWLLPFISAVMLVLVARFPSMPMIGLLLTSYFICSPLLVLTESNIQHNIASSARATVTSAANLFAELASIALTLIFGVFSRIWDLRAIYLATAIFLFVFAFWVMIVRRKLL